MNDIGLNSATAYSYQCNACSRCCYDKRIQLNPFEIARLAANRGIGSTAFLSSYTEAAGAVLKAQASGACIFLQGHKCSVHADRPLVCRLYPLGRIVDDDGHEEFVHVRPHPQTDGVYGEDGSIANYLDQQDAAQFIDATSRYHSLLKELSAWLNSVTENDKGAARELSKAFTDNAPPETDSVADWFDIDSVVDEYIRETGSAVPKTIEQKMQLHIAALRSMIATLNTEDTHEPVKQGNERQSRRQKT